MPSALLPYLRLAPLAPFLLAPACINKGDTAITVNNAAAGAAGAAGSAGAPGAVGGSSIGGAGGSSTLQGGTTGASAGQAGTTGDAGQAGAGAAGEAGASAASGCAVDVSLCPHETYVVGPIYSDAPAFDDLSQRRFAVGGAVGDERVFWAVREPSGDVTVRFWPTTGQPAFGQGKKLGTLSLDAATRCPSWFAADTPLAIAADEDSVYLVGCDTVYAFAIGEGPSVPAVARSQSAGKTSVFPAHPGGMSEPLVAKAGALAWYSYCESESRSGSCLNTLPAGSNGDSSPATYAVGPQGPTANFTGFVRAGTSFFASIDNSVYELDTAAAGDQGTAVYTKCQAGCFPPIVDEAFVRWAWRSGHSMQLVDAQRNNPNSQETRSIAVPPQAGIASLCADHLVAATNGGVVIANCESLYLIGPGAETPTRLATLTPTGSANLVRNLSQIRPYHGHLYAFDSSALISTKNSYAIVRLDLPQ